MHLFRRIWPLLASNLLMLGVSVLCMAILSAMRGSGRAALLTQIDRIDFTLRPLEDEFSKALGAGARVTTMVLEWTAAIASGLFLALGVLLSRSILARADLMEKALLHQATHDELTGLVNRREFERRVADAINRCGDQAERSALLYVDLDQFKIVNDTCGHPAGDQLIRRVAETIRGAVRGSDTLARLGGDEFGLLLGACTPAAALSIAEALDESRFTLFAQDIRPIAESSPFGYLRRLPVDYVKIDGSFVHKMDTDAVDRAMVASIQRIARVMGLRTVAEHVENESVLALLREVGVDYAQGFAIARPAPLADLLHGEHAAPAAIGVARACAA